MGRYLTRRCIGLHAVTLVLVSSFLLAAWWQYECARGGNGLSWAYTFEWPAFALYAVYMWWKLIHDQRTAFDRLWAAKQHAAADAFGTPLHQIPGWALDKTLSRAVVAASIETGDALASSIGAPAPSIGRTETFALPEPGDGEVVEGGLLAGEPLDECPDDPFDRSGSMIDARVTDVRVAVDENLTAYNRYLAELNRRDLPKQWAWRRNRGSGGTTQENDTPVPPTESVKGRRGELPADRIGAVGMRRSYRSFGTTEEKGAWRRAGRTRASATQVRCALPRSPEILGP